MPLTKFTPLQHGLDEYGCWIDLLKVTSIAPLLGAPFVPEGEELDLSAIRAIGSRVGCGGQVFDLTVQPDALASLVAAARNDRFSFPSRSPAPARPH